jgi:hypothetical protein
MSLKVLTAAVTPASNNSFSKQERSAMRRALAKPTSLPRFGVSSTLKRVFVRQKREHKNQVADSIFSLASQRCAGFTTRPRERKEQDY